MKALSSVLLLCITLFGLSAHAVKRDGDCPLKNFKNNQLLGNKSTNPYDAIMALRGNSNSAVDQVNTSN